MMIELSPNASMNSSFFIKGSIATILLSALVISVLTRVIPEVGAHLTFILVTLAIFVGLMGLTWYLVYQAYRQNSREKLIQTAYTLTTIRFLVSIGAAGSYVVFWKPSDNSYIYPFFAIYLFFMFFESYYLINLEDPTLAEPL